MPRSALVIHGIVSSYFQLMHLGNKLLLVSLCLNLEVIIDPKYLILAIYQGLEIAGFI